MERANISAGVESIADFNLDGSLFERRGGVFDFVAIRARLLDINQKVEHVCDVAAPISRNSAETGNLRELIERDTRWWPEGFVVDGADHFRLK